MKPQKPLRGFRSSRHLVFFPHAIAWTLPLRRLFSVYVWTVLSTISTIVAALLKKDTKKVFITYDKSRNSPLYMYSEIFIDRHYYLHHLQAKWSWIYANPVRWCFGEVFQEFGRSKWVQYTRIIVRYMGGMKIIVFGRSDYLWLLLWK